ncbi:hypothetical protein [Flavobacterium sp.]|uniref:DUF5723 family protein n=1 Tax=Flavobacterium sp. TaxID=239 RepID=UPI0026082CFE|nr:hypothetical protein [Flavobacterium sp.]
MKKSILVTLLLAAIGVHSQEHFAGLSTSSRVGILNAGINPSELNNMSNRFEVNIFGGSFNVANNKIGFSDLTSDTDFEELIFTGSEPVNARFDMELYGIGVAVKHKKWGFGFYTKATGKLDLVDIDTKIGEAIANSGISSILAPTTINNNYNQRINGTTWGEVAFSASRNIMDSEKHKFNVGATFKLLFPGSYANLGLDKFSGTITNVGTTAYLSGVSNASLNIAYSGGLADSFSNFDDYSKSVFGGMNGFATDLGFNYQWKDDVKDIDESDEKAVKKIKNQYKNKYKLNAGMSIRNIGSMTFKDDNNYSTDYVLNIPNATIANPGLDLSIFENVESLDEVEAILISEGYLNKTQAEKKDFKVKLPTTFTAYADLKLVSKLFVSGFIQQKLTDDSNNDQITAQNILTITPRFNTGFFEVYAPLTNSEVSGFNAGVGLRLGGFYLGSGSIITALANDSKQADIYTGFRWAFL